MIYVHALYIVIESSGLNQIKTKTKKISYVTPDHKWLHEVTGTITRWYFSISQLVSCLERAANIPAHIR